MKNTKIKNQKSHFSLFRFIVCSRQFPSTEVYYEAQENLKLFFLREAFISLIN